MARVEIDYNLENLTNFFKFFPVHFGEIAEKLIKVCPSKEKSLNVFLIVV